MMRSLVQDGEGWGAPLVFSFDYGKHDLMYIVRMKLQCSSFSFLGLPGHCSVRCLIAYFAETSATPAQLNTLW